MIRGRQQLQRHSRLIAYIPLFLTILITLYILKTVTSDIGGVLFLGVFLSFPILANIALIAILPRALFPEIVVSITALVYFIVINYAGYEVIYDPDPQESIALIFYSFMFGVTFVIEGVLFKFAGPDC